MKSDSKAEAIYLLAGVLLLNILASSFPGTHIGITYIFLFLVLVPGWLIIRVFRIDTRGLWETIGMSAGLSILTLIFGSLLLNYTLPIFGVSQPLAKTPILIALDTLLIILIPLAHARERKRAKPIFSRANNWERALLLLALITLILSILGAKSLNTGGTNAYTLIALTIIAIGVIIFLISHKKIGDATIASYIFLISLALLLMFSLRSNHISGWDINLEYQVFQVTKTNAVWMPGVTNTAYNSSLSITILPTVLANLTGIADEYVYKLLFQAMFALLPTILFLLYRRFATAAVAFLATFLFIAQPWFIQPMPALMRQEIAYLFFGLALLVLFSDLPKWQKNTLFVAFSCGVIVAHYSTAYVALAILTTAIILSSVVRYLGPKLWSRWTKILPILSEGSRQDKVIDAVAIVVIIAFSVVWYTQVNSTAQNIIFVVQESGRNLHQYATSSIRSQDAILSIAILPSQRRTSEEIIKEYIIDETKKANGKSNTYVAKEVRTHPTASLKSSPLPPRVNWKFTPQLMTILNMVKFLTKLCIIIGALYLLITPFRSHYIHYEYAILVLAAISILVALLLLPTASLYYNPFRLYLQVLIVAALPAAIGLTLLFRYLNSELRVICAGALLVAYFLFVSGVVTNVFGGYAFMHTNNQGEDYSKFYTHEGEVQAARWVGKNHQDAPIYADPVSDLRLISFGNQNHTILHVVPSAMTRESYVYARASNIKERRTDNYFRGAQIAYPFPTDFLESAKNSVYSNEQAKIYR